MKIRLLNIASFGDRHF